MLKTIKIYTSDKCWQHILMDLGAVVVDSKNTADVVLDDVDIAAPVSVDDLKSIIFNCLDNQDIISNVLGQYVVLPKLQHKIIVTLYKNPDITIRQLKDLLGLLPDVASHVVENAIYSLRKNYGRDIVINMDGRYKIGHV